MVWHEHFDIHLLYEKAIFMTNPTRSISILGCGWLGMPLAQNLKRLGFQVKGSTTHPHKLSVLQNNNIHPYLIQLNPEINSDYHPTFFESQVLIVNVPPARHVDIVSIYTKQMNALLRVLEGSSVEKVLFVSSTSVYPDVNREVTEKDASHPDKASGAALLQAETSFLNHKRFQTTVLRFCGLYGPGRNPGRFLAGKVLNTSGHAGVNLIHLEDCIRIIVRIIEREIWGEVLNACADFHPAKRDFYPQVAKALGLEAPVFKGVEEEKFKIINSEKLKACLNYHFLHPDPMQSLTNNQST